MGTKKMPGDVTGPRTCETGGYVAYDNSPGCGEFAIKDSAECGVAVASLLGSKSSAPSPQMTSPENPPGCLMLMVRGEMKPLFNTLTGKTGNSMYKSVCHKNGNLPEDASS